MNAINWLRFRQLHNHFIWSSQQYYQSSGQYCRTFHRAHHAAQTNSRNIFWKIGLLLKFLKVGRWSDSWTFAKSSTGEAENWSFLLLISSISEAEKRERTQRRRLPELLARDGPLLAQADQGRAVHSIRREPRRRLLCNRWYDSKVSGARREAEVDRLSKKYENHDNSIEKGSLNNEEKKEKKHFEEMTVEGMFFTRLFITAYFCSL